MIRGAIYRIDLAAAKRGHEQRGHRYGLIISPTDMDWSVVTVVPTSTRAQATRFRPEVILAGVTTRLLVDQIRSIDTKYVVGEPEFFLSRHQLLAVERAIQHYLGL